MRLWQIPAPGKGDNTAMQAMIIGNAPSLIGKGKGGEINGFSGPIVRTSQIKWQIRNYPEDYGTRVDYLCSTVFQFNVIGRERIVPEIETWIYTPPAGSKSRVLRWPRQMKKYKVVFCDDITDKWCNRYNQLIKDTKRYYKNKISKGCAAAIIAMQKIEGINLVILAACDNLTKGMNKDYYRITYQKKHFTMHNFGIERRLLDEASAEYNVGLKEFDNKNNDNAGQQECDTHVP